ncbi:MAG: PBP1A family penicillin-binding protein [Candidatus Nealsonbacteria bacterium]|nr:PBP1A family penicillin-binding protein [Candidatus Nealsonbacteria bacterium]
MAERKFYRRVYQRTRKKRLFFLCLKLLGFGLLSLFAVGLFLVISYAKDLPRPDDFKEKVVAQSTKIYARDGQTVLYEIYGEEKRTVVSLDQVSPYLKDALLAAEDADFYHHRGVSLKGIARAVLADLKFLSPSQGASTISQQLIRSSYLGREKTGARKTREVILTLELERRYSKEQILEFYLNQIPFGRNAYGIESASQSYFQKSARDLSLAEAAVLVSLIKAPGHLSPDGPYRDELFSRKDYVLQRMIDLKFITPAEGQLAKEQILKFAKISQKIRAPHFALWIKSLLEEKYGEDFLKEKGLKVYTTLDWKLQESAEKIVEERVKINQSYHSYNAAVVILDPRNGEILALVGSKDFFADSYPSDCQSGKNCLFEPQFNVALASRQPGSSFKPFVYATAFKKGFDDKTVVIDEQTNFGEWGGKDYIPQNYDGLFRGAVTLRRALAQSLNIPSIKVLLNLAGLEDSIQTAKDLGLTTLKPPFGPSIVLGGYETKLLEMASAYGAFANNGLWLKPVSILRIEDDKGKVIEENKTSPRRVLETRVTALINDILSDNEARSAMFGPRSLLFFENYRVAVKTGTTQSFRDGWTIGYTPSVVIGVWTGNNDNSPMRKEPGIVFAGPIFHELMANSLSRSLPEPFPEPESLNPERHQ